MAGPLDCVIPVKFARKILDTLCRAGFTSTLQKTVDDFQWYEVSSGAERIGMGVSNEVDVADMVGLMWSPSFTSSRLAASFVRILIASGAAIPDHYGYAKQYHIRICPENEMSQWIEAIQKAGFRIDLWPGVGGPQSRYRDGAVGAWPMQFRIYTGPAVEPTTAKEADYIAIENKCWALRPLQNRVLKMS